jgi:TatA/E family protein of Tat protein translocase
MFIDLPELLIIMALAFILFGPEKLPELAHKMGQMVRKFKQASANLQSSVYLPPDLSNLPPPPSPYQEQICPHCQQRISPDFAFCPACGQRVKEEPVKPSPPAS